MVLLRCVCFVQAANEDILHNSQEEGWRWRQNVRISIEGKGAFDFSGVHKNLGQKVANLTHTLRQQKKMEKNICMGGFSLIYENMKGVLECTEYMPLDSDGREGLGIQPHIGFISGDNIKLDCQYIPDGDFPYQGTVTLLGLNAIIRTPEPFLDYSRCIQENNGVYTTHYPILSQSSSNTLIDSALNQIFLKVLLGVQWGDTQNSLSTRPWYPYIGPYTSDSPLGIRHSLARKGAQKVYDCLYNKDDLETINTREKLNNAFTPNLGWAASFVDSEQNMLIYMKRHIKSHLKRLISKDASLQNALNEDINRAKALIVHVCSQRDMCELCALTLFRESELFHKQQQLYAAQPQQELRGHLYSEIRVGLGGAMPPEMKLLFMTSSNEPYNKAFNLTLSRDTYSGLDRLSFCNTETMIDLDTYAPFGIQIAMHRHHVPLLQPGLLSDVV